MRRVRVHVGWHYILRHEPPPSPVHEGLFTETDPPQPPRGSLRQLRPPPLPPPRHLPLLLLGRHRGGRAVGHRPALGLDGRDPSSARLPGRRPLRVRGGRATRRAAGRHPADRSGSRSSARTASPCTSSSSLCTSTRRAAAWSTYAFAPDESRLATVTHASRSPASGSTPSGASTGSTVTDMGVTAVSGALAEAGVGRGGFQAAFCGTAYGGVATGHKVLGALGMTGMPIVDVEAGCASGAAALMLGAAAITGRAVRHGGCLRGGEDAAGHHPFLLLRPLAGRSGLRGHAGLLRPAGPTIHDGHRA